MKGLEIFLAPLVAGLLVLEVTSIRQADIETVVNLTQTLKYNDSCSWSNERVRMKFAFARNLDSERPSLSAEPFVRFVDQVLRENLTFCAASEMVVCDRDTQRCKCGDSSRELFPRNLTNWTEFVLETDADGTKKCRWAEGSYCLSTNTLEGMTHSALRVPIDVKCQEGTHCVAAGTTRPCTSDTFAIHKARKYRNIYFIGERRILRDIYKGQVCKCQREVDPPAASSSSEEERDWSEEGW